MTAPRCEQISDDVTNVCEICGAGFWVKPYRRQKARFCSQQCGGVWHAKERLSKRDTSYARGNQWRKGLRPSNAFAPGITGKAHPSWKMGVECQCEHCGKTFHRKPWVARQNGPGRFCSRACFQESGCFSGEKSSTYVGGKSTYRGRSWPAARLVVVGEQKGECAHCRKLIGKSLPVHHIKPFREFSCEREANARSNLIGLCQSCHMKAEPRPRRISDELRRPRLPLDTPAPKPVQEGLPL